MKRKYLSTFSFILVFGLAVSVFAIAEEGEGISYVEKKVTGIVSNVRPEHIDIVYKTDEKKNESWEMGFNVNASVELNRKKDLSDIQIGDKVSIDYVEKMLEYEYVRDDGSVEIRKKKTGTEAKEITFVRGKRAGLSSGF
ncbi:MAG: hypothetical protein KAI70_06080 [Candidatus Omnitrophica bacterium]|nr:hypothetical protein [Candidatus Omnitrophota bacterium]